MSIFETPVFAEEAVMVKRILAGFIVSVSAAAWLSAQAQTPAPQGGAGGRGGQGGGAGQRAGGPGGGGGGHYPTAEQWTNMPPSAKAYVDKATQLAGNDPDLKF